MAVAVSRSAIGDKVEEHMLPTKITSTGELTGIHEYTMIDTPSGQVCASDLKDGDLVMVSPSYGSMPASYSKIKNVKKFVSSHVVILTTITDNVLVCAPLLNLEIPCSFDLECTYAKDYSPWVYEHTYRKDFDLYNMVSFDLVDGESFYVHRFSVKF